MRKRLECGHTHGKVREPDSVFETMILLRKPGLLHITFLETSNLPASFPHRSLDTSFRRAYHTSTNFHVLAEPTNLLPAPPLSRS